MRKLKQSKLILNKESIVRLNEENQMSIQGGAWASIDTRRTCNPGYTKKQCTK
jgi:hypothetical protein